jgi:hypothetical protein
MVTTPIKQECPKCGGKKVVKQGGVEVKCSECWGKGFIWKYPAEDFPPGMPLLSVNCR